MDKGEKGRLRCDRPRGSAEGNRNGRTYESIGLRPNQIMVLHFEPN